MGNAKSAGKLNLRELNSATQILYYVNNRAMNKATVRERFGFNNVTKASGLLGNAIDNGRIRIRNPELDRRYTEYVPY